MKRACSVPCGVRFHSGAQGYRVAWWVLPSSKVHSLHETSSKRCTGSPTFRDEDRVSEMHRFPPHLWQSCNSTYRFQTAPVPGGFPMVSTLLTLFQTLTSQVLNGFFSSRSLSTAHGSLSHHPLVYGLRSFPSCLCPFRMNRYLPPAIHPPLILIGSPVLLWLSLVLHAIPEVPPPELHSVFQALLQKWQVSPVYDGGC